MRLSAEIKENSKLVKDISKSIYDYIYDFIFKEALEIVQDSQENEMQNDIPKSSMELILRAIKESNIIIDDHGNIYIKRPSVKLSKAIQKLNPTKNRIPKAERESLTRRPDYKIDLKKFPNIVEAQQIKNDSYRQNVSRLNILVQEKQSIIDAEIKQGYSDFKIPEEKLDPLIEDIVKKTRVAIPDDYESFGIATKVDKGIIEQFRDEYLRTTSLPIIDMKQRAINRMRKEVLPLVVEKGVLPRDLAKFLQKEYGESKRHAEFLARQEIKLIKSKIIKDRALRTGHSKYIWRTAGDERVRSIHKELNKKHCDFNDPPIIDNKGNRGNPGEDYNCYSNDTEVYTERGFVLIKDVMQGEKILTLNPKTKDLEWATCINNFKKYEESILEFKNKSFLLKCSKNHTFFTYKYIEHTKGNYTIEPRFIHGFNNLGIKTNRFYCSSCWVGDDIKFVNIGNQKIPIKDFCLFMGYYLSEGSVDNRDDRNAIKISQSKYLDEMYENLSFFNPRKGKEAIYIFNTDLKNYLKQFGYSYQKYVPNIIKQLPSEYIRIFLDAFCLGDGSPKKIIYSKRFDKNLTKYNSYYTSSKRLANDLVELIIKGGMSATLGIMKCKNKVVNFRNGTYKINHDMYDIRENVKKHRLLTSMNIREIPYNDYVYDIEVNKNHTLLIKTGNFIHWNSNCRCIARIILTE